MQQNGLVAIEEIGPRRATGEEAEAAPIRVMSNPSKPGVADEVTPLPVVSILDDCSAADEEADDEVEAAATRLTSSRTDDLTTRVRGRSC